MVLLKRVEKPLIFMSKASNSSLTPQPQGAQHCDDAGLQKAVHKAVPLIITKADVHTESPVQGFCFELGSSIFSLFLI